MVCGNFILPEPASYVFFYAFSNLRNLLYIINKIGEVNYYVAHNIAHGRNYSKPKQKRFYQKQEKP